MVLFPLNFKFMICCGFYQQTPAMSFGVKVLALQRGLYKGIAQFIYMDIFAKKTVGVEMENKFVEPCHKQPLRRITRSLDLDALLG